MAGSQPGGPRSALKDGERRSEHLCGFLGLAVKPLVCSGGAGLGPLCLPEGRSNFQLC